MRERSGESIAVLLPRVIPRSACMTPSSVGRTGHIIPDRVMDCKDKIGCNRPRVGPCNRPVTCSTPGVRSGRPMGLVVVPTSHQPSYKQTAGVLLFSEGFREDRRI